ncbi:hypothetical protein JTE90_004631 [Oedothorax gibbosus]|uniref:DUF5745 domain-containing protein n=1 Tax=Oedothorax gibbosus TaxID=931172 RepID=A0AAV6UQY6_9ARAC|nr:hypothetical protein JTE90_004631 [Oedothorax gibbosus]
MEDTDLEKKCLGIANNLLINVSDGSNRVRNVGDINSDLIVFLFESITNHNIPDLLVNESKEAEAHNIQAVIDTLSLDLLGISLSHITGEDVVALNLVSICDLLEVLQGVANYLKSRRPAQPHYKNRILKRKIRKKNSSSLTSDTSVKSVLLTSSPSDYITQRDQFDTRKTQTRTLGLSSSSTESRQPSTSGSTIVDADKQGKKKLGGLFLSTSNESLSSSIKRQDSYEIKTISKPKGDISSNIKPISKKSNSTPEFPINQEVVPPPQYKKMSKDTEFRQQFQQQTPNKFVFHTTSSDTNSPQAEIERNNVVPPKEMPTFAQRNLKRKLARLSKKENIKPSLNEPQKEVEEMFETNFENRVRGLLDKNSCKTRASQIKNMHLQSVRKPHKRLPISSCKKSFLLPHNLRRRSISHNAVRRKAHRMSPIKQETSRKKEKDLPGNHKEGFLQEIFDEFPEHHLPPSVMNHIRNKYQQHLLRMHKQVKSILLKKPKTQIQAEEAAKKQSLLKNIINKDIQQQRHLNELKEQKKFENQIKFKLRDARLQSAKMKQYCEEFRTEMRKKMQKRNFSEELVIENVFKESLRIQKEQVDRLCEDAKETSDYDARQHLVYLEALENLYQTQFSMLAESLAAEKIDEQIRAKAEQQDMNAMQREFQNQLKQEIRFMQKVIIDCTEDIHFREIGAEQFKMKLRKRL